MTEIVQLEKSDDLDKVYKLFGVCAHHCSNIEYSMAFLLHPVKWNKHSKSLQLQKSKLNDKTKGINNLTVAKREFDIALDNVDLDIDGLSNVTLGNLVKQVNENYPLSDEQKIYFKEIVIRRNYVIHKMWGAYGRRLKDPQIVKEMLTELQGCETYFRLASGWLRKQAYLLNGIINEGENDQRDELQKHIINGKTTKGQK